jgi:putative aminopeptidase FrvX
MKKILLLLFVLLLSTASTCSNRKVHFKKVFSQSINGKIDVRLDDYKNVSDIVSDTFAIDVEFAPRWAMSIGHSLYGATKLNKKPAILLITYKGYSGKYVDMLMPIAKKYNITVWTITYYGDIWKKIN